jgi:hypothetical protein
VTDDEPCPTVTNAYEQPRTCTTEGKQCTFCYTYPGSSSQMGTSCSDNVCTDGTWKALPRKCPPCPAAVPAGVQSCYGDSIGCRCGYDGCGASRRTFRCDVPGLPPAAWIEDKPAVPCDDAGM